MSNLTKWGDWGDAAVKADAAAAKAGQKSYLKLAEGDNAIRFLPPKPGAASPLLRTYNHYLDMPDGRTISFNCPRMMAKRACAVCFKAQQLADSNNQVDQKAGRKMFPRLRVYANIVDRAAEDLGVQIYAFGKQIMDDLLAIRGNPRKGGNFTHPVTGRDIIINRTGTGKDTRYSVTPDVQGSPLHADSSTVDYWLEMAYDLDALAIVLDDDAIRAKLSGKEVEPKVVQVQPRGRTVADDADAFDPDSF